KQRVHPVYGLSASLILRRTPMVAARDRAPSTTPSWLEQLKSAWPWVHDHAMALFGDLLPKGLYARALIIIIAPIVLLESVIAFVFMERHWQSVTRRLSESTARDIAALIALYKVSPREDEVTRLIEMARDRLNLSMQRLPSGDLPPAQPKPFFSLLDRTLS